MGGKPVEGFAQVVHRVPMLSLNNGFADEDVEAFDRRVSDGLRDGGAPTGDLFGAPSNMRPS